MVDIEFNTKHYIKSFGTLEQGAFFTVITEVEHHLYIKSEIFDINSAANLAVNAIELNTGKGYYMTHDIIVADYDIKIIASEVGE